MTTPDGQYLQSIETIANSILRFLQTFETIQDHLDFIRFADAQAQLQDAVDHALPALPGKLESLAPPSDMQAFHISFTTAVTHFIHTYKYFLNTQNRDMSVAFMQSRRKCCLGLDALYSIRAHLPILQPYWVLDDALRQMEQLETYVPGVDVPIGMTHNTTPSGSYSLYVPECYSPDHQWPLILCLHGASGSGNDYIWTWLRPAKSRGYIVLSPKSSEVTWSILNLSQDTDAMMGMLDSVCDTYSIDRDRIYLTGLSDGGTFAYLLGLSQPDKFAGVVPIAGDMLHGMADNLLRRKQGKDLPIFIVHGAHDPIFPVRSTRSAYQLLMHLGWFSPGSKVFKIHHLRQDG